jgi:hypothetical protein
MFLRQPAQRAQEIERVAAARDPVRGFIGRDAVAAGVGADGPVRFVGVAAESFHEVPQAVPVSRFASFSVATRSRSSMSQS